MPRFKNKTIVHTSKAGPIRTVVEASEGMLSLFTQKGRNDLLRDAMWAGGMYWRSEFLPMRFTDYAKRLGYKNTPQTLTKKIKANRMLPLVWTGDLKSMADGTKVEARASKSNAVITIRIPGPPYMNQQRMVYKILRTIPPWEIERIADNVAKALAANLSEAAPMVRSDNKLQKLSENHVAKLQRSVAPRRSPRSSSRKVA